MYNNKVICRDIITEAIRFSDADRFRASQRIDAEARLARANAARNRRQDDSEEQWTAPLIVGTMTAGVYTQRGFYALSFIVIGTFLHSSRRILTENLLGLTAGFALAHTLFAFAFIDITSSSVREDPEQILAIYAQYALPFRCTEYVALTISALLLLDRSVVVQVCKC